MKLRGFFDHQKMRSKEFFFPQKKEIHHKCNSALLYSSEIRMAYIQHHSTITERFKLMKVSLDSYPLLPSIIPDDVTHIDIQDYRFPVGISSIPEGITHLRIGNYNHPILKDSIPSTIKSLIIGEGYRHPLCAESIPITVKEIYLPYDYDYFDTAFVFHHINAYSYYREECLTIKVPPTHEKQEEQFDRLLFNGDRVKVTPIKRKKITTGNFYVPA